jgi:hypothetical protein
MMLNGFPDVSRSQFRRIDRMADDESGEFAARLVRAHLGKAWSYVPDRADWFDIEHDDRGTKIESKSTHVTIDGENPDSFVDVAGRFRLWRSQVRSLMSSDARGTAWIVFVVFDEDGVPIEARRMRPSTVWGIVVDEFGGWDASGHQDQGQQQKLPIDAIFG